MLDEMLFFEIRIFKMFCDKAKVSASEGNKLFDSYGIWKYIEDTYEMMHLNGDESCLINIFKVLQLKGIRLGVVGGNIINQELEKTTMDNEQKVFCAELILTAAIMDMAEDEGISRQEARSRIINSPAYDALYNFDTGLWTEGPDYFRSFYQSVK